jgi:hypothetical protein
MKRALFIFLTILSITHFAMAQEPSLWLGLVEMRIGMPQATVINHLSKFYDLKELISPDQYLVLEKKLTAQDQITIIGQVAFDNGKLTYAVKHWYGGEVGAADKLVDALHSVLTQMEQRGEFVATIETRTLREPDTTMQEIKLAFGKRQIIISTTELKGLKFKGSKQVAILETISYAPFPK